MQLDPGRPQPAALVFAHHDAPPRRVAPMLQSRHVRPGYPPLAIAPSRPHRATCLGSSGLFAHRPGFVPGRALHRLALDCAARATPPAPSPLSARPWPATGASGTSKDSRGCACTRAWFAPARPGTTGAGGRDAARNRARAEQARPPRVARVALRDAGRARRAFGLARPVRRGDRRRSAGPNGRATPPDATRRAGPGRLVGYTAPPIPARPARAESTVSGRNA